MSAVGCFIESLSLNGRLFAVTADADVTRELGGLISDVEVNGDGSSRLILKRMPPSLKGIMISIDDSKGDQEFINDLVESKDFFPVAITYSSGISYQGSMQIASEMPLSVSTQTMPIDLIGTGKLTQQ